MVEGLIASIITWLRSTESQQDRDCMTLVNVADRREYLSAAFADYDGPGKIGRITSCITGLFDFEVLSVDGHQVFFRQIEVAIA